MLIVILLVNNFKIILLCNKFIFHLIYLHLHFLLSHLHSHLTYLQPVSHPRLSWFLRIGRKSVQAAVWRIPPKWPWTGATQFPSALLQAPVALWYRQGVSLHNTEKGRGLVPVSRARPLRRFWLFLERLKSHVKHFIAHHVQWVPVQCHLPPCKFSHKFTGKRVRSRINHGYFQLHSHSPFKFVQTRQQFLKRFTWRSHCRRAKNVPLPLLRILEMSRSVKRIPSSPQYSWIKKFPSRLPGPIGRPAVIQKRFARISSAFLESKLALLLVRNCLVPVLLLSLHYLQNTTITN